MARFWFKMLEFIATDGLTSCASGQSGMDAFLGVAVPSHISQDTDLLWFAPVNPVESIVCTRMLRNYHRNANLKQWYFKSAFFLEKGFSTPRQLQLYATEPNSYVSVCSRLIHSFIYGEYTKSTAIKLERKLAQFNYYEHIGLNDVATKEAVLTRLEEIKTKSVSKNLSKAKILLIKLILEQEITSSNQPFMLRQLYAHHSYMPSKQSRRLPWNRCPYVFVWFKNLPIVLFQSVRGQAML